MTQGRFVQGREHRMHSSHRRNTNIVWSLLVLSLAAWSIYKIYQHDSESTLKNIDTLSLQGEVLNLWASIHPTSTTSPRSPEESIQLDAHRTLHPITDARFSLETAIDGHTDTSLWEISKTRRDTTAGTIYPGEKFKGNIKHYKLPNRISDTHKCTSCHHQQTMHYSIAIADNGVNKRHEILSILAGYLLLLTLGISLSNISYNRLLRSARTKRIYEEKMQEQYESQKAISDILELAISNIRFSDKLKGVLDIITGVSWLQLATRGIIFTTNGNELVMAATKGIPQVLEQQCQRVALGECLCGAAANKRTLQYTPGIEEDDNRANCNIASHGHYCIPVIHEEKILGLLTLYVAQEHQESGDEAKFLTAAGNSLGTMIHKNRIEEKLRYDAYHDQLTGLANRALLSERVDYCINRALRDGQPNFCLLFLDLDRFKYINDSLGHCIGDSILVETAKRLEQLLREDDVIARLGGDEFVFLLDNVENLNAVYRIAERIHQALQQNIRVASYDLHTTCSIGLAYYNNSYTNFEQMLRDADIAMHIAKSSSTDRTVNFDHQMHQVAMQTLSIESALRSAGVQRELVAHFQPIYSTTERRFIGAEALIRWNRDGNLTPPSDFIGIAEDSGLIIMLGEYVLHEACKMITRLSKDHSDRDFYISVNVSAKQMLHRNLIESIDTVLEHHGTPTRHLRLEITESLFADNSPLVSEHLIKIKARGIKLLIDDFGTGYSSLSFLHNHPFDCVKIDRSFVSRISSSNRKQRSEKLIKTIIELARNLEMTVIAEGVEEQEQLDYLHGAGCELIQGYLFSRPLSPDGFMQAFTSQTMHHPSPHQRNTRNRNTAEHRA